MKFINTAIGLSLVLVALGQDAPTVGPPSPPTGVTGTNSVPASASGPYLVQRQVKVERRIPTYVQFTLTGVVAEGKARRLLFSSRQAAMNHLWKYEYDGEYLTIWERSEYHTGFNITGKHLIGSGYSYIIYEIEDMYDDE